MLLIFFSVSTMIGRKRRLIFKPIEMNKTLHGNFSLSFSNQTDTGAMRVDDSSQLTELMVDMKQYWQDASKDLLTPRSEAVAQLLKKVKIMN